MLFETSQRRFEINLNFSDTSGYQLPHSFVYKPVQGLALQLTKEHQGFLEVRIETKSGGLACHAIKFGQFTNDVNKAK